MPTIEGIKNALPINWNLIKNPVNWITVFLMVAIAGAGIAMIYTAKNKDDE